MLVLEGSSGLATLLQEGHNRDVPRKAAPIIPLLCVSPNQKLGGVGCGVGWWGWEQVIKNWGSCMVVFRGGLDTLLSTLLNRWGP